MRINLPIRVIVICLSFFIIWLSSTSHSFAQSSLTTPQTNPDVPQNLHTYTQSVVIELLSAFVCQLAGVDPINPQGRCLGIDRTTGNLGFVEDGGGVLGAMGTLIGATYNIPFSSGDYIAYLGENFGLTKQAYAQTQTGGFTSLAPLRNLWVSFRNIVYLLFIIVFIFVGLGIMLRLQIDPRTVMTIQNQIPKIIIGLLLVTFSYAIAGLLVDFMWITTYLSANMIAKADPNNIKIAMVNKEIYTPPIGFVNSSIGNIIGLSKDATWSVTKILFSLFVGSGGPETWGISNLPLPKEGTESVGCTKNLVFNLLFGFNNDHICAISKLRTGEINLGQIFGSTTFLLIGWLIPILGFLVILIAILWALFRLWFALIKAFVFILVDVVIAPFWIMLGILPGNLAGGFGGWLRDLIANLSAFPVTIVMFLFGRVFMDSFGAVPPGTPQFIPPLIGNPGVTSELASLVGVGIILMTPQVVNMTKEYLKAPSFKYTAAIGQAVGVGAAYPMATGRLAAGTYLGTREYVPTGAGGWRTRKWWEVFGGRATR